MDYKRQICSIIKAVKVKYIAASLILIILLQFFGVFTHIFERNFYDDFNYPMEGDIREYVMQLRANHQPSVAPINQYNFSYLSNCANKCNDLDGPEQLRLVYIIKSAVDNFDRRAAIRNTWGFQKRFSDVPIRTIFLLGVRKNDSKLQSRIDAEQQKYYDIVQANFVDAYFNNTIKTMIGFQWAVNFCAHGKFYMFSDDDMYVSTKNILRFVRNPTNYPKYLEEPVFSLKQQAIRRRKRSNTKIYNNHDIFSTNNTLIHRNLQQVLDFELEDDVRLFAGYVFLSSPHRHKISKWHVSLEEYPYHMWPPYVTAGAYVVSREALLDIYYGSFFTKHFRFDDIYLGLVAKKVDLEPYHCSEFHFYKKEYDVHGYRYVIASHGYSDPNELIKVWNEQKSAGNA